MKLAWATAVLLLGSQGVTSLSIPFTSETDLIERDPNSALTDAHFVDLEKRRGGGGGGGRSGGGSSSSGSSSGSSSSSGGSSGGRSGSSSSGSSGSGSSSSSSNRGGSSSGGSGVSPSYGGGRYYAGGARAPYTAGTRSPLGLTPFLLPVAALAFFPGIWLFGAYAYPYTHPYYYNDNNNRNQSLPVTCLCEQYQECGCDDVNNSTYYESLFNGTQPRNTSNVQVVNVNGTKTIVINGTLPNGTTADDGTSGSTSGSTSGAASGPLVTLANASGYWVMVAVVVATVWSI